MECRETTMGGEILLTMWSVSSGIQAPAPTAATAEGSMSAGPAMKQEKLGRNISLPPMVPLQARKVASARDTCGITSSSSQPVFSGDVKWSTGDFLSAHDKVVSSGRYNYQACRIPIPTTIRYDRLEEALGDSISPKEQTFLKLLKYGMPIGCKLGYGVSELKKNHHSALSFKEAISKYLAVNLESQAMLGPFCETPVSPYNSPLHPSP